MLFSQKPNTVLFVERDALTVYPKTNTTPLTLPDDVCKYLEIRDPAKLDGLLSDFAQKNDMRGRRLVIVLHKDVLFQKALTLTDDSDVQALIADYEHKMPFDADARRAVGFRQKDRLFLFGANKAFYQAIVAAMEGAGAKVYSVVPGLMYGITEPSKLTHTKLEQILTMTTPAKAINFLAT